MPTAWRLVKTRLAGHAFDGEGSRLFGGRWSTPGTRVVYTSESLALAMLEVLVHFQASKPLMAYSAYRVHFDERMVTSVESTSLPKNWRAYPAPPELQAMGARWVARQTSLILKVPSAIIETEHNYLINPAHPDFRSLVIDPPERFVFDPRLI